MLLTVKTISDLLKRERNFSAISKKIQDDTTKYISANTISRIARNADSNIDTNTLQILSDYFVKEFDYAKIAILNLRGNDGL
jgi:hypothetical protein